MTRPGARRPDPPGPGPFDVLVLGSGVAGLSAAVRMAGPAGRDGGALAVGVMTKGVLAQSATRWAQGGVAAVLGGEEDTTDLHLADTLAAGAGLCDFAAVRVLVDEGPLRVHELIALGAEFDREASGTLALAREGGHSHARVVHAGGAATGMEVERALVEATRRAAAAVLEGWFALDLLIDGERCTGVRALAPDGRVAEVAARHVVLATGGAGQLYSVTTNPPEATGDGVAMALRAGVAVADVEFVQFHPTALHHTAMPRPLLSEALRGYGAVLRGPDGERFVDELQPRDVVSRAMAARMRENRVDHLWLDATGLRRFSQRFPTIARSIRSIGLDPATDWLPVAPAAHHLSGGVLTDLWGATELRGLWAAGEVACTGVHGANRLASNSLLEGMVFGARLAEAILDGREGSEDPGRGDAGPSAVAGAEGGALGSALSVPEPAQAATGSDPHHQEAVIGGRPLDLGPPEPWSTGRWWGPTAGSVPSGGPAPGQRSGRSAAVDPGDLAKMRYELQRAMTDGAGVVRSAGTLAEAAATVSEIGSRLTIPGASHTTEGRAPGTSPGSTFGPGSGPLVGELTNLLTLAQGVVRSAAARQESRGAHARSDFPVTDPGWRCRLVLRHSAVEHPTAQRPTTQRATTQRATTQRATTQRPTTMTTQRPATRRSTVER